MLLFNLDQGLHMVKSMNDIGLDLAVSSSFEIGFGEAVLMAINTPRHLRYFTTHWPFASRGLVMTIVSSYITLCRPVVA